MKTFEQYYQYGCVRCRFGIVTDDSGSLNGDSGIVTGYSGIVTAIRKVWPDFQRQATSKPKVNSAILAVTTQRESVWLPRQNYPRPRSRWDFGMFRQAADEEYRPMPLIRNKRKNRREWIAWQLQRLCREDTMG